MILLLALLLVTAHPCGSGPVVLSMTTPLDCAMDAGCTIENIGREDAYRVLCACQARDKGYWGAEFENWTDWPECGGHKLPNMALLAPALGQPPIPALECLAPEDVGQSLPPGSLE